MTEPVATEAERARARDPATPPLQLVALLDRCMDEVLANPAWPLALVAHPDLWLGLPVDLHVSLLESERCPPEYASWALRRPSRFYLRERNILLNPALPRTLRRAAFLQGTDSELGRDPDARQAMKDVLSAHEADLLVRGGLDGAREAMTDDAFELLAALGPTGQQLALEHPLAPGALLERLFDAGVPGGAFLVPRHPRLSPARLAAFLESKDEELRAFAAMNPSLTPAQLQALFEDPSLHTSLARNPSIPAEWFEVFTSEGQHPMLLALAANPRVPEALQLLLAEVPSGAIRYVLMKNPGLSDAARQRLLASQQGTSEA